MKNIIKWFLFWIFIKFISIFVFVGVVLPTLFHFGYSTGIAIYLLVVYIFVFEYIVKRKILKGKHKELSNQCWDILKGFIDEYKQKKSV